MRSLTVLRELVVGVFKKINFRDRQLDFSCARQVDRASPFFEGEYAMLIH